MFYIHIRIRMCNFVTTAYQVAHVPRVLHFSASFLHFKDYSVACMDIDNKNFCYLYPYMPQNSLSQMEHLDFSHVVTLCHNQLWSHSQHNMYTSALFMNDFMEYSHFRSK